MATIENRSRYVVGVKNNDALTRGFTHDRCNEARAFLLQLRKDGYRPQAHAAQRPLPNAAEQGLRHACDLAGE